MHGSLTGSRPLLAADCIALRVPLQDATQVFGLASELLLAGHGLRATVLQQRLARRENRGSTGLGHGMALPHCDMPGLKRPVAAFLRAEQPLAFHAPDGAPVHSFLVLVVPRPATGAHFELLQHWRGRLANEEFRRRLAQCADVPAVWRCFEAHADPRTRSEAHRIMLAHSSAAAS